MRRAGRGGPRPGAGRHPKGPPTLEAAIQSLERLLTEIKNPANPRGVLAQQLVCEAMRLRRRVVRVAAHPELCVFENVRTVRPTLERVIGNGKGVGE